MVIETMHRASGHQGLEIEMLNIEKLTELGGKLWEKGDKRRVYFNAPAVAAMIGLNIHYYGTGNISSANLNGEKISNSRARRMMDCNIYIDLVTGEVEGYGESEVFDMLKQKLAEIEESEMAEKPELEVAVYQPEGILAVGADIEAAVIAAGYAMSEIEDFNGGSYNLNDETGRGPAVDMLHTRRVTADAEAAAGASAKIRYITPELAELVRTQGGDVAFDIRDDGVLDVWQD